MEQNSTQNLSHLGSSSGRSTVPYFTPSSLSQELRVKDFFKHPPAHTLKVGDLVTCNCHGGLAVVIALFDEGEEVQMNMAKKLGYELVDHRLELYGKKIKK